MKEDVLKKSLKEDSSELEDDRLPDAFAEEFVRELDREVPDAAELLVTDLSPDWLLASDIVLSESPFDESASAESFEGGKNWPDLKYFPFQYASLSEETITPVFGPSLAAWINWLLPMYMPT